MSDVKLNWEGKLRFTAIGQASLPVAIDGDRQEGASPMELVLAALGACTSIDVVAILEKMRQPLDHFEITIAGKRRDNHPKAYTDIEIVFCLAGEGLDESKVARAVELSIDKYCSVLHSLDKGIKLATKIEINK